ncbi:hypothetical protein LWI28_023505 [Acer negundo]|uniref:Uncharacterized protein n=1 Tax=Acer negundo TaxID=4023 RepID=A0AAD5J2M9_ACENE|nr:hypothetical protein LWI28_023505 [Acer negundo]
MAVSLLFLMMMITRSRRNMAWALPGGGGHPLSSSTSQSMGDQKTTTNNTYIVVETPEFVRSLFTSSSNHDVEEDCSARKTLSYKDIRGIFYVYVAALIFELVLLSWLPNVDAMEFEKRIIKLQEGLNMDSLGFENCFNRIAQSAAGLSKPEMLQFGGFYKDMLRAVRAAGFAKEEPLRIPSARRSTLLRKSSVRISSARRDEAVFNSTKS